MKRVLCLALCLVMAFGLCACGGNDTPVDSNGSDTPTKVETDKTENVLDNELNSDAKTETESDIPDDSGVSDESQIIDQQMQEWEGKGKINVGLNFSDENEFALKISQMDNDSIEGTLVVNPVGETNYSLQFIGTGKPAEGLNENWIFYDITWEKEILKWSVDSPGYTELTMLYQPKEDQFSFFASPFEAVLKKK